MKKIVCLILVFLFVIAILLTGCKQENDKLNIAAITDIHFAGKDYYSYEGTFFDDNDNNGSGKQMKYLDEIIDAFISQISEEKPDYLLVTGDLTLFGAKVSHIALSEKFFQLEETGINVLVLPGNHDITSHSYIFSNGEPENADSVTPEEFSEIYGEFGFSEALSRDENSLSYVFDTGKGARIFMLDTNFSYGTMYGQINDKTAIWLEEELKKCKDAGDSPIVAGHHNLLVHNPMFTFGYTINNAKKFSELFKEYGVSLYLSGHMHIQHISEENGLFDVAEGSFAVFPHRYGQITFDKGNWDYESKTTDVTGYALKNGIDDENLLNYEEYGFNFFYKNAYKQARQSLETTTDDKEMLENICDYSAKLNVYYFGGTPSQSDNTYRDDFIKLSDGTRWGTYMGLIIQDENDSISCSNFIE